MPHRTEIGKKHVKWNREPRHVDLKKHPLGSRSGGGKRKAGKRVEDMTPNECKRYAYYGKKMRREGERLAVSVEMMQMLDARMGKSTTMAAGYNRSHDQQPAGQQAVGGRQGHRNQANGDPESDDLDDERHYKTQRALGAQMCSTASRVLHLIQKRRYSRPASRFEIARLYNSSSASA